MFPNPPEEEELETTCIFHLSLYCAAEYLTSSTFPDIWKTCETTLDSPFSPLS